MHFDFLGCTSSSVGRTLFLTFVLYNVKKCLSMILILFWGHFLKSYNKSNPSNINASVLLRFLRPSGLCIKCNLSSSATQGLSVCSLWAIFLSFFFQLTITSCSAVYGSMEYAVLLQKARPQKQQTCWIVTAHYRTHWLLCTWFQQNPIKQLWQKQMSCDRSTSVEHCQHQRNRLYM